MKEIYEEFSIDLEFIHKDDVITTSTSFDDNDHDNGFIDWGELE